MDRGANKVQNRWSNSSWKGCAYNPSEKVQILSPTLYPFCIVAGQPPVALKPVQIATAGRFALISNRWCVLTFRAVSTVDWSF